MVAIGRQCRTAEDDKSDNLIRTFDLARRNGRIWRYRSNNPDPENMKEKKKDLKFLALVN